MKSRSVGRDCGSGGLCLPNTIDSHKFHRNDFHLRSLPFGIDFLHAMCLAANGWFGNEVAVPEEVDSCEESFCLLAKHCVASMGRLSRMIAMRRAWQSLHRGESHASHSNTLKALLSLSRNYRILFNFVAIIYDRHFIIWRPTIADVVALIVFCCCFVLFSAQSNARLKIASMPRFFREISQMPFNRCFDESCDLWHDFLIAIFS